MNEIERRMAIWLKGKEYCCEWDADANLVIYPKSGTGEITAVVDLEKQEAHYGLHFSEPQMDAIIPGQEYEDLKHFVEMIIGEKDA